MNDSMRSVGVGCVALLVLAGCGSSSKSSNPNTGHKDGGGTSGKGAAVSDAGALPSNGDEGAPCDSTHKCTGKLSCVESLFVNVSVCGRGCTTPTDCKTDEVCFSYSKLPKDGHCVNLVNDEYATCGVADTSICNHRSCLYLPQEPIGVCIDTCALEASASGDDAGAGPSATVPQGAVTCAPQETCVDGVLSSADANEGVCGIVAKRGEACGIEQGIYCDTGDICAPKDPNDLSSELLCFQDCSAAGARCDQGKCIDVQGVFAYCM